MVLPSNSSSRYRLQSKQNFRGEGLISTEFMVVLTLRQMFRIRPNELQRLHLLHPLDRRKKNQSVFRINVIDFLLETSDGTNQNSYHSMAWKVLLMLRPQAWE